MPQTSYPTDPAVAFAGHVAQTARTEVISKAATEDIAFGRFVSFDASNDDVCKLPTTAGEVTDGYGFAIADTSLEDTGVGYQDDDMVAILRRGYIYCDCLTAAAALTDDVFVEFTDAGDLGKVRNDNNLGNAALLPGARFAETIAAAGLVKVEFSPQT